ncbi:hypothetical protein U1872_15945 [Sphingomonas sp. RB3P16]
MPRRQIATTSASVTCCAVIVSPIDKPITWLIDDGSSEIDNEVAECGTYRIAIGSKDWLYARAKADGERAAAIYTVIETCKLNGIEPQATSPMSSPRVLATRE